jgi:hypothetical protein
MEDIFSTLLTLVPIAIFIGLRLLGANRKKAAAEENSRLATVLKKAAADPPPPTRISFLEPDSDGEVFDAHSLRPDDDESVPLPPKRPAPALVSAPPPVIRFEPARAAAKHAAPKAPVYSAPAHPAPTHSAQVDARPSIIYKEPMPTTPFGRLDRLSTLKKAVVFAELLGEPKGM